MQKQLRGPALSKAVRDYVKQYILDRKLQGGDPLPPETQLAQDLGVGRSSVREAIKALQSLNLRTEGSVACYPSIDLTLLVRVQLATNGAPDQDVTAVFSICHALFNSVRSTDRIHPLKVYRSEGALYSCNSGSAADKFLSLTTHLARRLPTVFTVISRRRAISS